MSILLLLTALAKAKNIPALTSRDLHFIRKLECFLCKKNYQMISILFFLKKLYTNVIRKQKV